MVFILPETPGRSRRNPRRKEAIFFGIGADLLAWLQLGRELTATIGVIIATGLVLIEVLLRVSERSRWKPRGEND